MPKLIANPYGANHLTRAAQAYFTDPNSTVWWRAAPIRNVTDRSGRVTVFSKSDSLRASHDGARAGGGKAQMSHFGSSTVSYACEHRAAATLASHDDVLAHRANGVDPRMLYGSYVTGQLHRIKEDQWETKFFGTGDWTTETTLSGTDQWNSSTGGDPRGDVRTAKAKIRDFLGGKRDGVRFAGICNGSVFDTLKAHPGLDNLGGLQARDPFDRNEAQVAAWLGLDLLIVGSSSENTAQENATASISEVLADNMLVAAVPANYGNIMQPTAMLNVVSTQMQPVFTHPELTLPETLHAEVDVDMDLVKVDADLGYLIIDCNG